MINILNKTAIKTELTPGEEAIKSSKLGLSLFDDAIIHLEQSEVLANQQIYDNEAIILALEQQKTELAMKNEELTTLKGRNSLVVGNIKNLLGLK